MLPLILAAFLALQPQSGGVAQAPAPAQEPLRAEFYALSKEFNAARLAYDKHVDDLRKAGTPRPESQNEHPARAYWPRFEALAQRGSAGACLWMATLFPSAHPALAEAERDKAWREHILAAVQTGANTASAAELARAFTAIYLDAPGTLVDEAVELFVNSTTQRETAADALYRASLAKRRGSSTLASPKAAEFGQRLLAEYGDSRAARQARGEPEVGLGIGYQAPDFTAVDGDAVSFKLSDYRGKVVVLDFWGYW